MRLVPESKGNGWKATARTPLLVPTLECEARKKNGDGLILCSSTGIVPGAICSQPFQTSPADEIRDPATKQDHRRRTGQSCSFVCEVAIASKCWQRGWMMSCDAWRGFSGALPLPEAANRRHPTPPQQQHRMNELLRTGWQTARTGGIRVNCPY
ncbi:hypothetical protein ASPVEDRAFT_556322 [Aspergillus versicolor CBS 583.65]|uniref:Uncharacterized protein n=1 Tax=Aspergillus versicolor CBS 583.65 TaxID=1036611 RepID=A0A1L9PFG1_ASPVE|nr:uncharacterized protein ASPVEDRAFT_556322 [Aspergillus versicolor CBS 583.65]OJJ00233.1 hypothetical protein ASPVEDRAFT_556322 [Aspergillus versicolor CBS 583.65]